MSVENLYSYLEYLNLAIDQLEEAVTLQESDNTHLSEQLAFVDAELLAARREIDRLNAQIHVYAQQAQAATIAAPAAITAQPQQPAKQKPAAPQDDLFGGWTQTPAKAPARASVANDQNALILAKKLDSTIDKVQRLIGQGK